MRERWCWFFLWSLYFNLLIRSPIGVAFFKPKDYLPHSDDVKNLVNTLHRGDFNLYQYLFGCLISPSQGELLGDLCHPRRIFSLDSIIGYCINSCNGFLSSSLSELRDQLRENGSAAPSDSRGFAVQNLASALLHRFMEFSQPDDLDEAIWLYQASLGLTSQDSYRYLEILLDLSISLHSRFKRSGQTCDHAQLQECLSKVRDIDLENIMEPVKLSLSYFCARIEAKRFNSTLSMPKSKGVLTLPLHRSRMEVVSQPLAGLSMGVGCKLTIKH